MEDKIYIKFDDRKGKPSPPRGRLIRIIENAVIKILSTVIPKANPNFKHLIDKVDYWKIEYNKKENVAWREIGFDKDGTSIGAMPFEDNYGYWTDNQLKLDDYNTFDATSISADEFQNDWLTFEKKMKK